MEPSGSSIDTIEHLKDDKSVIVRDSERRPASVDSFFQAGNEAGKAQAYPSILRESTSTI